MNILLLPTSYFPNLYYISLLKQTHELFIETQEHFVKQSYRTRCSIYSANGILDLNIPIFHQEKNTPIEKFEISYQSRWNINHYRAIESAYRKTPYFEYYQNEIYTLLTSGESNLLNFNETILNWLLKKLNFNIIVHRTTEYKNCSKGIDFREIIHPKNRIEQGKNLKPYYQIFADRYGFQTNLSILDLLFHEGPSAITYL